MIFVTVGTQLAFDRLVMAVDEWAEANPAIEIFAQIGPGVRRPKAIPHADFVPPEKADALIRQAELVVAHAGMGSILTALRFQRPILIMPRKADLGEHRNDHQFATARWLDGRAGISVAWSESEISEKLDQRSFLVAGPKLAEFASGPLIERLGDYIRQPR